MRTTVELDPDVKAAVEQLRRSSGAGVSDTVNSLIRRGLVVRDQPKPFVQATRSMGARIDVSNVADALDLLEGPSAR